MKKKRLFLDDLRLPTTNHAYMDTPMRLALGEGEWDIVRNYKSFTEWITKNGLPEFIMFDHDLEYQPAIEVDNLQIVNNNEYIINQQFRYEKDQPNGLDCAKWLVNYCQTRNLNLPPYLCHSQNHYGKRDILELLDNYKKQIYR